MTGIATPTDVEEPHPYSSSPSTFFQRHFPQVKLAPLTAVRLAGFVPVVLVLAIIVLAYVTAVPATLYPLRIYYPAIAYPLLLIFHFIYFNVVANYLLLVFVDPGSPPDSWKAPPPPPLTRPAPRLPAPRLPSRIAAAATALAEARQLAEEHRMRAEEDETETETLLTQRRAEHSEGLQHHQQLQQQQKQIKPFRYAHWMRERSYDGGLRYCRTCKAYKPDRSHHCSVCRKCVLRMDHHCVFVNNCVSFINHKFFISFVTYAFLGCLFVAIVSFPTFAAIVSVGSAPHSSLQTGSRSWKGIGKALGELYKFSAVQNLSSSVKNMAMIGYIITTAFAFALAIFVTLHFYLVAKGRTTIELYELTDPTRSARVAEYDLGMSKNFRGVFGSVPICWFFPTRAYIQGDGLQWERRITTERSDSNV